MKFKKVMLGLGVGILAALFIGFLIEAIYPNPKYDEYCNMTYYNYPQPVAKQGGLVCDYKYNITMRENCSANRGMIQEKYDTNGCVIGEMCDFCDRDYQAASEKYNRNLFYITAPIALVMIILGLYLPLSIDAIAGGMLFGGILTLLQVTMRVFGNLGKWTRVVLLGLELALVIWIGVKKVKERQPAKKKR